MKKILAMLLALVMVLSLAACGGAPTDAPEATDGEYKVAMVTDYGDITDQSFNQTTWEAVVKFGEDNKIPYKYFKPVSNDTAGRVAQVELAIAEGYNVIVMPGFAFAGTIYEVQDVYPEVKFIGLDVSEFDLFDSFYTHDEDGNQTGLIDENNQPHISSNVYCAIYQEELCGYMAGYAAVKLGYTKLGFLGGMAVPAVMRYGYGYVQGVDTAAKELGITVDMKYVYGNQFFGDSDIKAYMDTWYANGTEIVFACGGGIYTSAVDAAKAVEGAKVIGVDTDQSGVIAAYAAGEGGDAAQYKDLTVTSAMKGLAPTTIDTLTDVVINGNWEKYSGKIDTLGLVSGTDASLNYVQIPTTTQYEEGKFTEADMQALVAGMFDGSIVVSNDIAAEPTVTNVNVEYLGNIK